MRNITIPSYVYVLLWFIFITVVALTASSCSTTEVCAAYGTKKAQYITYKQ